MKISEVLIKARDIIQKQGWCQGSYRDNEGRVCLETALAVASDGIFCAPSQVNGRPAGRALGTYLGLHVGGGPACPCRYGTPLDGEALASWNDQAGRTVEEVIEALEVCALIEAEKEAATPKMPPLPKIEVTMTGYGEAKLESLLTTVSLTAGDVIDTGFRWVTFQPERELVALLT